MGHSVTLRRSKTHSAERYFYDWEFLEDGKTILPISVGVKCSDGRSYYAVNAAIQDKDNNRRICEHKFLMENVVPHLPIMGMEADEETGWKFNLWKTSEVKPLDQIAQELLFFFRGHWKGEHRLPAQLWGYYPSYDHVCLAQLWGPMANMPEGLPYFTHDLQQIICDLEIPSEELTPAALGFEGDKTHNAMFDALLLEARWNRVHEISQDRRADMAMASWQEGYSSSTRGKQIDLPKDVVDLIDKTFGPDEKD